MKEKEIIDLVSKESNWEEVIEYIINEEGMDPWDIDIVKLADVFAEYILKMSEFDFKIPARIIIISAILLRMKVEILTWEKIEEKEGGVKEEEKIDLSKVPELEVPVTRIPRRKVTLDELVVALRKAFRTKEIREEKKFRRKKMVENLIEDTNVDIEERINDLYERINNILTQMKRGEITFRDLVPKWERKEIVDKFLPLLHLSQEGKVTCEQKEIFKDIYIRLKGEINE
ncbi:MAG: segregation/condensation protein A [Candidatus Aenigmarchaeota archaeon]|nr:segregation/condensation protein A [Candidatus Aenigmarchaeota archaeon]